MLSACTVFDVLGDCPMAGKRYTYEPINEAANEVRLLALLPAEFDAPVHATLRSAPLTKDDFPH
jgi:hypothetical protein